MNREKLLKQVQICEFAISDIILYLDTHPKNRKALDYYEKYKLLRKEAVAAYEEKYGPLTIFDANVNDDWSWVSNPWPWEVED